MTVPAPSNFTDSSPPSDSSGIAGEGSRHSSSGNTRSLRYSTITKVKDENNESGN